MKNVVRIHSLKSSTKPLATANKTFLAIVTFDLHNAKPQEYPRVKASLSTLGIEKYLKGSKITRLPHNTYAVKFPIKGRKASNIRDYLRTQIGNAISGLGLTATVFVAVGSSWAWTLRNYKVHLKPVVSSKAKTKY
jgi:hypothetical protein